MQSGHIGPVRGQLDRHVRYAFIIDTSWFIQGEVKAYIQTTTTLTGGLDIKIDAGSADKLNPASPTPDLRVIP